MNSYNKRLSLLQRGSIEIFYEDGRVKFCWGEKELTYNSGFNLAINTAGMWTDSSYGKREILGKGDDFVIVRNIWERLPISCLWNFKIERDGHILCTIDMEVEEFLEIDERRAAILVSPLYKTWVNSHEQGRFPQVIGWQEMPLENFSSRLVGVRFSYDNLLPPLALEFEDNKYGKAFPLIQNTSAEIGSHVIGVRFEDATAKRCYTPGRYNYFSGKIYIPKDEHELDVHIENKRRFLLNGERRKCKVYKNKKIKVLLINMPWQRHGRFGVRAGSRWPHIKDDSEGKYLPFPFFLAYSASLLRKNDIDVNVIDYIAEEVPDDRFLEHLSRVDFDILVTETSTPSFYYDMELLKKISALDVPIILCGAHTEIYKEEFLYNNNFIDFVLFGEYEFTLLELIKALRKGSKDLSSIDGLIWRDGKNNAIKNTPRKPFDINILPWPYRDVLPMERYWDLPGNIPVPSVQMVASRGCPFSCNFCLWPQTLFGNRTYRTRKVKDVVDEMEYLIRERNFKSVYFDDDTFNIGKERIMRLCDEIIKRGLNNTPWAIMARSDLMDEELLDKMKKAGLHAVKYGVENLSQELVNNCGKFLDLKKGERMVDYTKSLGIKAHLTFTFGLDGETKDSIGKTIDYALKADPESVQFSIATPFPGTRLFEQLDRKGKILTKDWSLYDGHYSCIFQPENLTTVDLEEAKRYAYRVWAEHQRRKRGIKGDIKKFFNYLEKYGSRGAFKKAAGYLNYFIFKRKKYIGKI